MSDTCPRSPRKVWYRKPRTARIARDRVLNRARREGLPRPVGPWDEVQHTAVGPGGEPLVPVRGRGGTWTAVTVTAAELLGLRVHAEPRHLEET